MADEADDPLAGDVGGGDHRDDARRRARPGVMSIRRTMARGWSLKRSAPWSIPGTDHVGDEQLLPERHLAGRNPVRAGTDAAEASERPRAARGARAWCGRLVAIVRGISPPGRDRLDRVDDLDVASAAAEVARQAPGRSPRAPAPARAAGAPRPSSRCPASRSRTGWRRWRRTPRPRLPEPRRAGPPGSRPRGPRTRPASRAHETTGRPSTRTVQAPHEPSGAQPSFIERSPKPSRRTSRRLAPGSTSTETGWPFRMKSIVRPRSCGRGPTGPSGDLAGARMFVQHAPGGKRAVRPELRARAGPKQGARFGPGARGGGDG